MHDLQHIDLNGWHLPLIFIYYCNYIAVTQGLEQEQMR
jgi:hypothetical protein